MSEKAISENSNVKLGLMIVLVGLAGSGAATGAVALFQISQHTDDIADLNKSAAEQAKDINGLDRRVTVGENKTDELIKKLDRMDGKLDRLLEGRGIRTTNYKPREPSE